MMCGSKLCSFDQPKDYPTEAQKMNLKLNPEYLTYNTLLATRDTCHDKYMNNEWSENNVHVYSSSKGINTEGANKIIEHASNIMILNYLSQEEKMKKYKSEHDSIIVDMKKNPENIVNGVVVLTGIVFFL